MGSPKSPELYQVQCAGCAWDSAETSANSEDQSFVRNCPEVYSFATLIEAMHELCGTSFLESMSKYIEY